MTLLATLAASRERPARILIIASRFNSLIFFFFFLVHSVPECRAGRGGGGKLLEPLTIQLPLTKRKCLIKQTTNNNKTRKRKKNMTSIHNGSVSSLPEEFVSLSPDRKLYTAEMQPAASLVYAGKKKREKLTFFFFSLSEYLFLDVVSQPSR